MDFEHYLQHLERTQVRSISDVVEYNYEHAEHALPKGDINSPSPFFLQLHLSTKGEVSFSNSFL